MLLYSGAASGWVPEKINGWGSKTGIAGLDLPGEHTMSRSVCNDPKSCIPGADYRKSKPASCTFCYWWMGQKQGCGNEECFYLIRKKRMKQYAKSDKKSNCEGCPYGRHAPCIGYCLDRLLKEMRANDEGINESQFRGR